MSLSDNGMNLSMPVVPAYGNGGGGGGFGWGQDWIWIIVLFLFAGGWNNNGFGGGGGGMNGGVGSEVQRGFDHSATITKLDGITTGLADLGFALNNTITNGFHGVDSAICNLGYNVQSGFNALGAQIANCCCETREAISGVRYDLATQACDTRNLIQSSTRDILENNNNNTRAILDFLTNDKIATLTAENQNLKLAASQAAQNSYLTATIDAGNAELIRRLGRDVPVPAYVVPNPNCCYPGYGAGYGNGCGCLG